MNRIKFTKEAVEALRWNGDQAIYWDAKLPSFGVRVGQHKKSFVVMSRIGGRGTSKLRTVGPVDEYATIEAAREAGREWLRRMRAGEDPRATAKAVDEAEQQRESGTFQVWLEKCLADKVKVGNIKPETADAYRYSVERYLADWLDKPLGEITPAMVRAELHRIADRVRAGNGHSTANGVMKLLSLVWNWARAEDASLPVNPCYILNGNRYKVERRTTIIPEDKLADWYAAGEALVREGKVRPASWSYLRMLLFTGARRTEMASLRWDDVDFEAGVITIPAERTKAKRELRVPISTQIADILAEGEKPGREASGWVFPGNGSASGHVEGVRRPLALIEANCGVKARHHDLRRGYNTIALGIGINPYLVKRLLNHSVDQDDMTDRYYVPGQLSEAQQSISDRIAALCGVGAKPDVPAVANDNVEVAA